MEYIKHLERLAELTRAKISELNTLTVLENAMYFYGLAKTACDAEKVAETRQEVRNTGDSVEPSATARMEPKKWRCSDAEIDSIIEAYLSGGRGHCEACGEKCKCKSGESVKRCQCHGAER